MSAEYAFTFKVIASDREGYYYDRWDRATEHQVIGSTKGEALKALGALLGNAPSGRFWKAIQVGKAIDIRPLGCPAGQVMSTMALRPVLLLCPSCGHDQDDHAPDHLPPYTCTMRGCHCSRTPDRLIAEAPDPDPITPPAAEAPDDIDDCTMCGGYSALATRRNAGGVWEERVCPRCGGTGNELGRGRVA